jgi:hypothetical protein
MLNLGVTGRLPTAGGRQEALGIVEFGDMAGEAASARAWKEPA